MAKKIVICEFHNFLTYKDASQWWVNNVQRLEDNNMRTKAIGKKIIVYKRLLKHYHNVILIIGGTNEITNKSN